MFKEIKEMTGSRSSICGAVKLSTGRVVSEENYIKKRWQQYTENLYRIYHNINEIFNENLYEDEPDVLEIEVKEAIRNIYNRKAPGCNIIPMQFLKAGGDESIRVMTKHSNIIWKTKIWPKEWHKSMYVPIYKMGDTKECGNYRTIALISHASKIIPRVLQKRLEAFLIPELPI